MLVEEGPARVRQLIEWGVTFDTQDGELLLGREAAHSRARILHARGDGTGLEVETALIARLRAASVMVMEHAHVERILAGEAGRCTGVEWCDTERGTVHRLASNAVILASGGAGRLWPATTNPGTATGDGVALAYEAGAEVAGMEFVQFHPTALALPEAPRFLISEAVRGEGATVVNGAGRRFLFDSDSRGELGGRDVVARSIWDELSRSGADHVYLDCSSIPHVALRFPAIHHMCREHGLDMAHDRIPVAPAAHYMIGGVRTDLRAATSLPGLYACGEVASSGVHGANRLASNSLLESVVFAHRAAEAALADSAEAPPPHVEQVDAPRDVAVDASQQAAWDVLQSALWSGAGIVREATGIAAALQVCRDIADGSASKRTIAETRLHGAATTASLVCAAALRREESRGCHIRSDHASSSDEWHGDLVMHGQRGAHLDRHV